MTYSRYHNTPIFLNEDQNYKNVFFRERDIQQTYQYALKALYYPSAGAIASFENVPLVWGATDKLYNISNQYYGSPAYWWVIAFYNKKASEAEFKVGDIYFVPMPLEEILWYF